MTGLSLCEKLTQLLGGEIWLDDDYDSGIEGCKGARFVIALKTPPIDLDELDQDTKSDDSFDEVMPTLPDSLSVLFVDDDVILRKLFSRTIRKTFPSWHVDEAASGEIALKMLESHNKKYDIIFLDQYMSSTVKQLLGTEVVREIRARGLTDTLICGLSANEIEQSFLEHGADAFCLKPFPCKEGQVRRELFRILSKRSITEDSESEESSV